MALVSSQKASTWVPAISARVHGQELDTYALTTYEQEKLNEGYVSLLYRDV